MNITYEYVTNLERLNGEKNKKDQTLVNVIDQRINDLRKEQEEIEDIFIKLSKFLHVNAILPFNDESIQYLRFLIRIERMKNEAGIRNNDVVEGLSKIIMTYEDSMDAFKKNLTNEKDVPNAEVVYTLFGNLRRLSINANRFRDSVNLIDQSASKAVKRTEKSVKLPEKAAQSTLMRTLEDIVSPKTSERF
jgi:hypothetical protein